MTLFKLWQISCLSHVDMIIFLYPQISAQKRGVVQVLTFLSQSFLLRDQRGVGTFTEGGGGGGGNMKYLINWVLC